MSAPAVPRQPGRTGRGVKRCGGPVRRQLLTTGEKYQLLQLRAAVVTDEAIISDSARTSLCYAACVTDLSGRKGSPWIFG